MNVHPLKRERSFNKDIARLKSEPVLVQIQDFKKPFPILNAIAENE
jgi:hypothetical protein